MYLCRISTFYKSFLIFNYKFVMFYYAKNTVLQYLSYLKTHFRSYKYNNFVLKETCKTK